MFVCNLCVHLRPTQTLRKSVVTPDFCIPTFLMTTAAADAHCKYTYTH